MKWLWIICGLLLPLVAVLVVENIELHNRVAKLEQEVNHLYQVDFALYQTLCDVGGRVCKTEEKLGIEPETVKADLETHK
jgi:hypothetical protein